MSSKKSEIIGALQACEYLLNSLCLCELNQEGRQHISNYMAQLIRQKMNTQINDVETMANSLYSKIIRGFEEKAISYLKANLGQFGYKFASDADFILFAKDRIRRISMGENYYEFYLDYVNENEKGVFIGRYSDKVNFNHDFDHNKFTVITTITIG